MKFSGVKRKSSFEIIYLINALLVVVLLLIATSNSLLYESFIIISFALITIAFYWRGKKTTQYIIAYASLITLLTTLFFAKIPFYILVHFMFVIPFLYALIFRNAFSVIITGAGILWIFTTYIGDVPLASIKLASAVVIIACIIYIAIIYLFDRLSKELKIKKIFSDISARFIGLYNMDDSINATLKDIGSVGGGLYGKQRD